jgi:hypothetical protein
MSTRRPSRAQSFVVAALSLAAVGFCVRPAPAQSLADVAKKEEERRQKVAEPTKVYTNKDLKAPSGTAGTVAPLPPAGDAAKDADTKAKGDKSAASTDKDKDGVKDPNKDPAYWSGRLKAAQAKLDQDQAYAEAMQTRINSLTTDAVNRDDPIQRSKLERDRQKALADLAQLKKSIDDGKKAIAQVHEDARRAGVPPGWLR